MANSGREIVVVTGIFKRETEKAILLDMKDGKHPWLPISQFGRDMEYLDAREGEVNVFIPRWLAEKNDLAYDEFDPDERDDTDMQESQDSYNELNFDKDIPF